jgi:dTDP-4-amino-4,6-dideoxygalactose transaminase
MSNITTPAIEGGTPVRKKRLPFYRTSHGEEEIKEVLDTLHSGWLTVGPKTRRFRKEFLEYTGLSFGVPLNSCTSSMFLALKVIGIGKGDLVITTPNTFTSTVNVIHHAGATPLLADIEETTFGLDPTRVEEAITEKTRAILAVHYGGQPCYIEKIKSIAEEYGLFLIEDVAHGFGAKAGDRSLGDFGSLGAFSFYATKSLSTGEGGFLTCADERLEKEAELMCFHGMGQDSWKRYSDRGSWYYEVERFGYKFNMTDIQAAMGLVQLKRADELLKKRTMIAERYLKVFKSEEALLLPETREGALHAWHLFVLRLRATALRISRDEFLKALIAEGISPSLHFIPIHHHPAHREFFGDLSEQLPVSERFYKWCFSLPLFPTMKEEEIEQVIAAVLKLINYYRS